MGQQIRILHVLGRLDRGGAETMVMNLYRLLDTGRIQFDFVIHTDEKCDYTGEIERLGGKIYSVRPFGVSTALGYCREWRQFFRQHPEYRVIHGHVRSTASLYLWDAKRAGLVTIAHSHNTSSGRGFSAFVKNILQYPLRFQADYLFACSKRAGIWLYGKQACGKTNFRILRNGIEPEIFTFDIEKRRKKRKELLTDSPEILSEPLVFLHIGRLETQKNHIFLIEVMREIVKKRKDARLWLCGVGPLEAQLKKNVKEAGLEKHIHFLGMRTDVPTLLQAADGMIFPSLFEGLPVTLVEAQAAGLPVLMSESITKEVILTDLVKTLSLDVGAEQWALLALEMAGRYADGRSGLRMRYGEIIRQSGYDAAENAKALGEFYVDVWYHAEKDKGGRKAKEKVADREERSG